MKPSALVIDDELQIRRLLRQALESAVYEFRKRAAKVPGVWLGEW